MKRLFYSIFLITILILCTSYLFPSFPSKKIKLVVKELRVLEHRYSGKNPIIIGIRSHYNGQEFTFSGNLGEEVFDFENKEGADRAMYNKSLIGPNFRLTDGKSIYQLLKTEDNDEDKVNDLDTKEGTNLTSPGSSTSYLLVYIKIKRSSGSSHWDNFGLLKFSIENKFGYLITKYAKYDDKLGPPPERPRKHLINFFYIKDYTKLNSDGYFKSENGIINLLFHIEKEDKEDKEYRLRLTLQVEEE